MGDLTWWRCGRTVEPHGGAPGEHLDLLLLAERGDAEDLFSRVVHEPAPRRRGGGPRVTFAPVNPYPPRAPVLHPALESVATRRYVVLDGCLVLEHDGAAATLEAWRSASTSVTSAEVVMNHVHLWDLFDEALSGRGGRAPAAEWQDWDALVDADPALAVEHFEQAFELGVAWQQGLEAAQLGVPVVIQVGDGGPYGPEVTAYRLR